MSLAALPRPAWSRRRRAATVPALCALLVGLAFLLGLTPVRADEEAAPEPAPVTRDEVASRAAFDEAEAQREEFKWGAAANLFWKAVEADPLNYRAHVRYQECSRRAGDAAHDLLRDYDGFVRDYPTRVAFRLHRLRIDPAEPRLDALAALRKANPKDPDILLEIGRASLAQGDAKAAEKALESALALQVGERPDVLLLLAEAEIAADKASQARKRLEDEVKARPEAWLARLMLARLSLIEGDAQAAFEQADIVLQQRPTFLAAFLVKSEALVASGKVDEGKAVLQTVYDRITKDVPEVNIALADLTARFETEAAFKQAEVLYTSVLEKDGESWRALYGLGWVLERQGKFPEAEEKYRQVQSLQPLSAIAVNSVGYCLLKQGRVSQAQVQFKRALDLDADYVTALANLGATFDAQAKYSEAIRIYEKILRMKGHKENLRALINCAFDHEAGGAFPKATKLLLKAHDVQPKDANICVWLGDNHYFQKKYKDAEAWYQKAIALDEKSYFGWRGLGLTLAQLRRWADCANALERASSLKPDDVDMYATLGDVYYEQLKDLETALKKYEEYVQRGGTDPQVTDAITEIKKELERK